MKLELKHLAPYLPYGLKARFMHPIEKHQKDGFLKSCYNINDDVKFSIDYGDDEHIWMFKPILRPLSDLWKDEYRDSIYQNEFQTSNLILNEELTLSDYNFLIENHFDIFGLIDNGLAIDINTL